jgi:hypothetical protein
LRADLFGAFFWRILSGAFFGAFAFGAFIFERNLTHET